MESEQNGLRCSVSLLLVDDRGATLADQEVELTLIGANGSRETLSVETGVAGSFTLERVAVEEGELRISAAWAGSEQIEGSTAETVLQLRRREAGFQHLEGHTLVAREELQQHTVFVREQGDRRPLNVESSCREARIIDPRNPERSDLAASEALALTWDNATAGVSCLVSVRVDENAVYRGRSYEIPVLVLDAPPTLQVERASRPWSRNVAFDVSMDGVERWDAPHTLGLRIGSERGDRRRPLRDIDYTVGMPEKVRLAFDRDGATAGNTQLVAWYEDLDGQTVWETEPVSVGRLSPGVTIRRALLGALGTLLSIVILIALTRALSRLLEDDAETEAFSLSRQKTAPSRRSGRLDLASDSSRVAIIVDAETGWRVRDALLLFTDGTSEDLATGALLVTDDILGRTDISIGAPGYFERSLTREQLESERISLRPARANVTERVEEIARVYRVSPLRGSSGWGVEPLRETALRAVRAAYPLWTDQFDLSGARDVISAVDRVLSESDQATPADRVGAAFLILEHAWFAPFVSERVDAQLIELSQQAHRGGKNA